MKHIVNLVFLGVAILWGYGLEYHFSDNIRQIQDNRRRLYDGVSKYLNVGSWNEFDIGMDDPIRRNKFFKAVSEHVYIGSFEEFEGRVTKKEASLKWTIIYSLMFAIIIFGIQYLGTVRKIVIYKEDKEPDVIYP